MKPMGLGHRVRAVRGDELTMIDRASPIYGMLNQVFEEDCLACMEREKADMRNADARGGK